MKLDPTITISVILALCAVIAPCITSVINNRHNYKMRKLELTHDSKLHYSDVTYRNKYDVYSGFIEQASDYSGFHNAMRHQTAILSLLHKSILLCDDETLSLLLEFQELINNASANTDSEYMKLLSKISQSFNRELDIVSRHEKYD